MGLLDNTTPQQYYTGSDHGNYQFTSLEDIINQFLVAYVGEEKIIGKVSRTDVAFHAQRAMQELSFDTFKSIKSQEITLPPSNTMILPHDYVNYTKVMWSDTSGIKHPIYPTKHTQNPFAILQEDDGSYDFDVSGSSAFLSNYNFESTTSLPQAVSALNQWVRKGPYGNPVVDDILISSNKLRFTHGSKVHNANPGYNYNGSTSSRIYATYQKINITGATAIDLTATATSAAASAGIKGTGLVRIGISTLYPSGGNVFGESINLGITVPDITTPLNGYYACAMIDPTVFNLVDGNGDPSYLEFEDGTTKTLSTGSIDTTQIPEDASTGLKHVYVYIFSTVNAFTTASDGDGNESTNTIDSVVITGDQPVSYLQEEGESTTWSNYKSATPSENQDDYQDDTYWPNNQKRYGLDPQHAQINGSFYIDNLRGLINFSSNISGKTVILDYISDSLGTDGEMQVHKFAEEAMYKWIMYAILSTRANTQEYIIRRYQKEKFAATRQAKLRLSNIKLEELTQILRGKSKHIKH